MKYQHHFCVDVVTSCGVANRVWRPGAHHELIFWFLILQFWTNFVRLM